MFAGTIIILIALVVGCYSINECRVLKNANITFTGEGSLRTTSIEVEEGDLENAIRIEIQDQNIPILCKRSIQNLHKLYDLIIESSGVKKISPGAFDNLPSLRNLIITNNDIDKIENGVFGDMLVRKLNLSSNKISSIKPRSFENMINMEVLDLSGNQLQTFENDWFQYTPKLYRLNFMYNKIKQIPENALLNIIRNKQKKHDLELWFSDNSISTIHKKAFNKLEKLEDVWLSNNLLYDIDVEVFAQIQEMQTLFLDNNRFTCVNDQFLKYLHVKEFSIDGNPIDCDCADKIKKWGNETGAEVHLLRVRLNCVLKAKDNNLKHYDA